MKVMRNIGLMGLLFTFGVYVQTASATLAPMLPTSSYADGHWQGFEFYNRELDEGGFLRGRVDFAVYDTLNLQNQGEIDWVDGLDLTGDGQYLYAYQIFNDYEGWSDREITFFSVFADDGGYLSVDESSIDSFVDPEIGVEAADGYMAESDKQVVWTYEPEPDGYGYIYSGQHSWFMVFLSDSAPVSGDYEVKVVEEQGEFPTPGPEIPEPASIALLGIGYALVAFRRRRALKRT